MKACRRIRCLQRAAPRVTEAAVERSNFHEEASGREMSARRQFMRNLSFSDPSNFLLAAKIFYAVKPINGSCFQSLKNGAQRAM